MRDNIFGYHQSALIKHGINLKDALLLDYLKNFLKDGKAKKITYDNKDYYMIFYKKILEDLPILDISYNRLRDIVRNLESKGFIEKYKADINSSILYLRIQDRVLTYTTPCKKYAGKDTLLTNFVITNWGVKKYAKPEIRIFTDSLNNERFRYVNSLINIKLIITEIELFNYYLKKNLQACLSDDVYNSLSDAVVINSEIDLYTKNSGTLQGVFEDNLYKIEQCICLSYINIYNNR